MPRVLALALLTLAAGCSAESARDRASTDDNDITVDTSTPEARRQYDANVAFANAYVPRCRSTAEATGRPRVLVTGFGRFMQIANNATGRIVSTLVPEARYPETDAPPPGEADPPDAQLSVAETTLELPGIGTVDVCAMILPVYWDLAAILIAKEADAFGPSFVMMNGVAGPRQPLWIELGATNRASKNFDGSNQLRPAVTPGEQFVKIVESAPATEDTQGNLLSWRAVEAAATSALREHEDELEGDVRFGDLAPGAKLAGFPRLSNTYLCNNVTYVTGWLMSHPTREVHLLRASTPIGGAENHVAVKLASDLSGVPRVFVHWPSELADKHHAAGADVMKAIIAAQLNASMRGDLPTVGDNALADPNLRGAGTFF